MNFLKTNENCFLLGGFQKIVKDRIGQLLHYTLTWLLGEQDWYSKAWFYKNSLWPKASLNSRLKILFGMISIKPRAYFLNQSLKILFVSSMFSKALCWAGIFEKHLKLSRVQWIYIAQIVSGCWGILLESFYIEHLISDFVMWKIGLVIFYKCLKNLCFIYRFK